MYYTTKRMCKSYIYIYLLILIQQTFFYCYQHEGGVGVDSKKKFITILAYQT